MVIYLVRNAEHLGEEKIFWAGVDVGLSLKGRKQAELVCDRLKNYKISAIYSSKFLRAIETVKPLADALNINLMQSNDFNAFNQGKFFGWTQEATIKELGEEVWNEIITSPDPNKKYFEGGETLADVSDRAWKGILKILKNHSQEETVVVSTHLTVIACLLCRIFGISPSNIWLWGGSMRAEHPSITTILHKDDRWYLTTYGCAEHLIL